VKRYRRLVYRFVGEPPPADAPKSVRARWVRRFYWLNMLISLPVYPFLIAWGSTVVFVAVGAAWMVWLWGVTSLSLRLRHLEREETRGPGGPPE